MPVLRTPEDRFADLPDFPFAPHHLTPSKDARLGPLRMHYLDEGPAGGAPGRAAARRAHLVVHVSGTPSVPLAGEAGLRVVVPDLVGFGRSGQARRDQGTTATRGHVEWLTAPVS